jgi:hypothetical protein
MHGSGKSDGFIVPAKSSNKAVGAPVAAERMEGRNPAKGSLAAAEQGRTQRRVSLSSQSGHGEGDFARLTQGKSPVR